MADNTLTLMFVQRVQEWHEFRLRAARDIQSTAKEGTSVKVIGDSGNEVKVEFTKRDAMIFSIGMEAGIAQFEKLPFTVSTEPEEEEDDEEL